MGLKLIPSFGVQKKQNPSQQNEITIINFIPWIFFKYTHWKYVKLLSYAFFVLLVPFFARFLPGPRSGFRMFDFGKSHISMDPDEQKKLLDTAPPQPGKTALKLSIGFKNHRKKRKRKGSRKKEVRSFILAFAVLRFRVHHT
ncbi:hypothetical protein [uncultured Pseudodesulfovibrio sp.]|uniref:hypothetical protein n=1 Tax=uncultured Pseudodesulfovibrio sp. TaxID=2035858 RepID=UPI0037491C80